MDTKELFVRALEATGCVKHIKPDQLKNDTPCSEWDLKTLLNHLVYEFSWAPDLFEGKTIAEVGDKYEGDLLSDDIQATWNRTVERIKSAVEKVDLKDKVHLSYGDVPAEHYIKELSAEALIHGWDIGQAVNCSVIFDDDVAKEIYDFALPQQKSLQESGSVGPPVPVDKDADIQTKVLSIYGRKRPESVS